MISSDNDDSSNSQLKNKLNPFRKIIMQKNLQTLIR